MLMHAGNGGVHSSGEPETQSGEWTLEHQSDILYKPFLIFSGGIAVAAWTGKNHMSTIISGSLRLIE